MPGREIFSISESELALELKGRTDGVFNGFVIDLQNVNAVLFVIISGGIVDGTHTTSFEESDDLAFSSPVAVPDTDLRGADDLVFTGPDDDKAAQVSVVNNKRFIRAVLTVAGTTGGVISIVAVKQMLALAPAV